MNADLNDLKTQYRSAARKLTQLSEYGTAEEFDAQRALCASLRREINARCPDSETYDPHEGNIVERV